MYILKSMDLHIGLELKKRYSELNEGLKRLFKISRKKFCEMFTLFHSITKTMKRILLKVKLGFSTL